MAILTHPQECRESLSPLKVNTITLVNNKAFKVSGLISKMN
jgi:hypothetical protein